MSETTIKLPELLPCPFCGYEASITEVESASRGGRIIHIVGCNSEDCDVSFHGHARKIDAAKAWNTRNESDALRGEVEAYRTMLHSILTAASPDYVTLERYKGAMALIWGLAAKQLDAAIKAMDAETSGEGTE